MIRGVKQPFKFTTPINFTDINHIEVIFSQPHNQGNPPTAPMPIVKYYDKQLEKVDEWDETDKVQTQTYQVDTKYYWYDSAQSAFVSDNTPPAEEDISGGAIQSYPLGDTCSVSKVYKCDTAYYQYNPSTTKWDITSEEPNADLQPLSKIGVMNIPSNTDTKRACIYNQRYYRYNGTEWITSTDEILPIVEINYWDLDKEEIIENDAYYYDRDKTYCALETYYKYDGNEWKSYGRPQEVRVLNDDCDKSKIWMMKELYYQYNVETDKFEKTGVREVYYKYNTTSMQWEECECPCIGAEEIDLWVGAETHDVNKTYVCKKAYYRYNAGLDTPAWESSNNMLVPVVEIDEWRTSDYHDTSKIYMCPTRYYQYNIEEEAWEEKDSVNKPQIVNLDYWSNPIDRDKNHIYLCQPTYFRYNSDKAEWMSASSFSVQFTKIDDPSEATDQSKVYECSPTYYAYRGGEWEIYKNVSEAVLNDGFNPVVGDPKSFLIELNAEETMRFVDKYKGRVQAFIDDIPHKMEYFSVYPSLIDELSNSND